MGLSMGRQVRRSSDVNLECYNGKGWVGGQWAMGEKTPRQFMESVKRNDVNLRVSFGITSAELSPWSGGNTKLTCGKSNVDFTLISATTPNVAFA